jgi:hypothetical protein
LRLRVLLRRDTPADDFILLELRKQEENGQRYTREFKSTGSTRAGRLR